MQKKDSFIERTMQISKLRKNHNDKVAIRYLAENTQGEYGILLTLDLINISKKSEEILLYFQKIIDNDKVINYSKKEIIHWISEISMYIKFLDLRDLNKIIKLINDNFSKRPLIGRELVLEMLRGLIIASKIEKIQCLNSGIKSNLTDYRYKYLLAKYFKEKNFFILAFDTLEKYVDNLRIILLKNEILLKISHYIFESKGESIDLISKDADYNESELELRLINIMNEYSEIFNLENQRLKEINNGNKISLKMIIQSLISKSDFFIQDLFISSEIKSFEISKQLVECRIISIKGIIEKVIKNDLEYEDLCKNLPEILEMSENSRNNIILDNFLLERKRIPYETSEKIIKYVSKNIDKMDNLVIFRAAKLCENVSDIEQGLKMLESLNTDSSRELIKEFQNKLDWLENGYDLSKIINENEVKNYSKTKNKILYFVHADLPYVTSGYTIRTGAVARNLSDDILDIEVVSRWGFPLDRVDFIKRDNIVRKIIDGHGIIHNFIPSESGMREYKNYDYIEQGVKNLVSQCMEIRPSLIISASDHVTGIIGLVTSKILNIPFIYEMRGLWAYTRATNNIGYDKTFDFNLRMKLEMQCALEAQKVITISESLKNIVINWGVDESKIELLPNCIEDFELSSEVLKIDPMFVKIGYLGSIVPYEGLITTIKAIQTMKNDNKLLPKLIIAGDGSEKSRLENYIEINKLGENIELRGKIEHTEINEFYNEVDAIILPRVSTLVTDIIPPLKPLEAISRGKIILFSDIFPHRELFDKIETPFMFKESDIESQINAIEKFINFPGSLNQIINNCRDFVQINRNYQKTLKPIKRELIKIMNQRF